MIILEAQTLGLPASLRLEPLTVGHAQQMVGVLSEPQLYAFTGGVAPDLESLRDRYRRQSVGRSPDGTEVWLNWILVESSSGRAVGFIQATVRSTELRQCAELAWLIGVPWQGLGYASLAAREVLFWLRRQGIESFIAHIDPQNLGSTKVAERLGFQRTEEMLDGEFRWEIAQPSSSQ